jgi:hypothetical protein
MMKGEGGWHMSMTDREDKVANLHIMLMEVIVDFSQDYDGDQELNIVFGALERAFVSFMALQCPNCRKATVRTLKKGIPDMLKWANQLATDRAVAGVANSTCH